MDNSRMLSETKRHHTFCRALLPSFFSATWPSPDPPVAKTELLLRTRCVCWTFLSIFFRRIREMSMRKGKKVPNCHTPCSSPLCPFSFLVGIFGPVHSLARTCARHCGGKNPKFSKDSKEQHDTKGGDHRSQSPTPGHTRTLGGAKHDSSFVLTHSPAGAEHVALVPVPHVHGATPWAQMLAAHRMGCAAAEGGDQAMSPAPL